MRDFEFSVTMADGVVLTVFNVGDGAFVRKNSGDISALALLLESSGFADREFSIVKHQMFSEVYCDTFIPPHMARRFIARMMDEGGIP